MTTLVKKTNAAAWLAAIITVSVFAAGCKKEPTSVTGTAQTAESIDLNQQTADLFQQPLKPDPLAPKPEDVVLTVEGQPVTYGEIMQGVQMQMMQMRQRVPPQQLPAIQKQLYKRISDNLVASILLTKAAEKSGLVVSDTELDEEIAAIGKNAPEGKSLKSVLAENNVDYDKWTQNLRKQMMVRKLAKEKTAEIPEASLADVTKFYEENIETFKVPENYTASHILLMTKDLSAEEKAAKKEQIEKIKEEINAGTITFSDAAKKYSEDPGSKENGGEYQNVSAGQMVPAFEKAAFAQEIGTIGDVVETEYGYHLIKVTDRQAESIRPLAEIKDKLQEYLTGQAKEAAIVAYIEELKKTAKIETHRPDFDAAGVQ